MSFKLITAKSMRIFLVLLTSSLFVSQVQAQQKFESGPEGRVQNSNHFSLGVGAELGASFVKDAEKSGIAYQAYIEPSYTYMIDPWSIAEFSLRLSTGSHQWEGENDTEFTMPVNLGVLVQVGYGQAISQKLFGIFKIGAGGFFSTLEQEVGSVNLESDSAELGLNARVSGGLRFVVSPFIDFTSGLSLDWKKVDLSFESPLLGVNTDIDVNQLNPNVFVSARIKI